MKIIPLYLPQFHTIPENDKWWGKGFTEWVNVKNAKPLFEGHNQPRVPLNDNYYDLSDVETLKWQCKIAREHGIYGFCMYHYWFNGHLLLEKPMEMLLAHPEIDIKYCISWANGEWRDIWKASEGTSKILIADDYTNKQNWINHFNYLLPFFQDNRYMVENNKPIVVIYTPHTIFNLNKMLDMWTNMAKENGFEGLTYIFQSAASGLDDSWDKTRFSYGIEMNPGYVNGFANFTFSSRMRLRLMKYSREIKRILGINRSLVRAKGIKEVKCYDYDEAWQNILKLRPKVGNFKMIPCAFTDWDNTPRHGIRGTVYKDVSTEKFKHYFALLIENAKKYYKTDMVFIFAWNEWAEGGYLEPDKLYGYGFLEAIKEVLD